MGEGLGRHTHTESKAGLTCRRLRPLWGVGVGAHTGWYDSGCLIKFGLPMAWTTTVLTWGLLQYGDAYHRAGEYDRMLDSIR